MWRLFPEIPASSSSSKCISLSGSGLENPTLRPCMRQPPLTWCSCLTWRRIPTRRWTWPKQSGRWPRGWWRRSGRWSGLGRWSSRTPPSSGRGACPSTGRGWCPLAGAGPSIRHDACEQSEHAAVKIKRGPENMFVFPDKWDSRGNAALEVLNGREKWVVSDMATL